MEQVLFSEDCARQGGLLQSVDVRVRLVSVLSIIMLVSVLREPRTLGMLYALSIVLAALSRVPLGTFLTRVWLFVPLFSAAIVLPALLNVVTPGDPLWVLVRLDGPHTWGPYVIPAQIAVTRQGLWGAITFVSRVATSVSFAVLFTLTTRWNDAFAGLRALFVPRIFVITLTMTERYLFLLLRMIQDMYRARKSRTIRPLPASADRNWIASRIGATFLKSREMSEDIYRAMLARGFHGEFRTAERFRVGGIDLFWIISVVCTGGALFLFDRGLLR